MAKPIGVECSTRPTEAAAGLDGRAFDVGLVEVPEVTIVAGTVADQSKYDLNNHLSLPDTFRSTPWAAIFRIRN